MVDKQPSQSKQPTGSASSSAGQSRAKAPTRRTAAASPSTSAKPGAAKPAAKPASGKSAAASQPATSKTAAQGKAATGKSTAGAKPVASKVTSAAKSAASKTTGASKSSGTAKTTGASKSASAAAPRASQKASAAQNAVPTRSRAQAAAGAQRADGVSQATPAPRSRATGALRHTTDRTVMLTDPSQQNRSRAHASASQQPREGQPRRGASASRNAASARHHNEIAVRSSGGSMPGHVSIEANPRAKKGGNRGGARQIGGGGSLPRKGGAALTSLLSGNMLKIILAVVLALGVFALVDFVMHKDRIYNGVHIGTVDVSGKTADEARALVVQEYEEDLNAKRVIIFSGQEVANTVNVDEEITQEEALAEQISVEEARENKLLWTTNATKLNAIVPYDELVQEAFDYGRGLSGVFSRIWASFADATIEMRANYDEAAVEDLAHDIDLTIGSPRVDSTVEFVEGAVSIVEGKDGTMVVRETFHNQLNNAFFNTEGADASFVAKVEPAEMRTDLKDAQYASEYLNALLTSSYSFSFGDDTWLVSPEELSSWIQVEIAERGRGHEISLSLDTVAVKASLLTHVNTKALSENLSIDIEVDENDAVLIKPIGEVLVPLLDSAADIFNYLLFGDYQAEVGLPIEEPEGTQEIAQAAEANGVVVVPVKVGPAAAVMTLEEARSLGLVTEISSYTTEFVNSDSTQNRLHNIRLVSDFINNSVIEANGGRWSFNETAGHCNEDRGFLDAGAILEDGYSEAVGGGICQVATTVFNAVYDAGYNVVRRHNHTLYISSYPSGRDAAVSYPDLDLIWANDTTSDVLLTTSYTKTTITVTLLGIDPGYEVSTEVGDWEEGAPYSTKEVLDDSLSPGYSYVKTAGEDGSRIVVYRTVYEADGSILYENMFESKYQPVTEVVVKGPDIKKEDEGDV